jgi:hypothetical protein
LAQTKFPVPVSKRQTWFSILIFDAFCPNAIAHSVFDSQWLSQSEIALPARGTPKSVISRILHQCKLSIPWMLMSFVVIWPIACGVCYHLYGHKSYNDYPIPQWSSALVGGVCALITCPFWAIITMVRVGEMASSSETTLDTDL